MAKIRVYTDDERLVAEMEFEDTTSPFAAGRLIAGNAGVVQGWLGRALSDARIIQQGGDPERPSEKVMRLLAEREAGGAA